VKIDVVHPAHYGEGGRLVQATGWLDRLGAYTPHLGPALLAACTPPGHEVRLVEEYLGDVDLDTDADLVAFSAQVMQFDRARDLSARFRARGKKTVLGGYLPSMLPERVQGLFDAVVVGEGDEIWPRIVEDAAGGRLRPCYRPERPVDLARLPVPRYDLIKRDRLVVYPVQATRGCPFTCEYCCITAVHRGAYRKRPVEGVLRDLEAAPSRNVFFCDDNLCEDVRYVDGLFTAMAGGNKRWGTQTTVNVAEHPDLLKKARAAGCVLMALGVETFSPRNLEQVNKLFQVVERFAEAFRRLMDAGISPHALIIFGLPDDDRDTFRRTVDHLERMKVPIAQFFIMTPYPGTPSGDRIHREGKVFDFELAHLREPYVVFQPDRLTPQELAEGWWWSVERFYSLRSILKRVVMRRWLRNMWVDLATNLYYWSKMRRGIHTVYFGR
jgi:radical SAM superfamily enzyme YgiQ (UPF0313 family)